MLWNLHALRGVACLLVVWLHLQLAAETIGYSGWLLKCSEWFGFAGVDVFFVLSGFILSYTYATRLRPAALPGYLVRRFRRIYPAYWVALAIAGLLPIVLLGASPLLEKSTGDWLRWMLLVPAGSNAAIPQAWSLTYEVVYYLVVGAIVMLPPRARLVAPFVWIAGAIVASMGAMVATDSFAGILLSPFAIEFAGGMVVAQLIRSGRTGRARIAAGLAAAHLAIAFAAIVAVVGLEQAAFSRLISSVGIRVTIFGPPAILAVYALASAEVRGGRHASRWLLMIGEASYSIYLTHGIVIFLMLCALVFSNGTLPRAPLLAATAVLCVVLGWVFHRLVERPLCNLGRGKREAVVPVTVLSVVANVARAARPRGVPHITTHSAPATAPFSGCR